MILSEMAKEGSTGFCPGITAEAFPQWYAVYTRSRHEKHVREQCERRSIEAFLPLYETVHRWKDRRMRVQLPLFPSYIFVRIDLNKRLDVLQIPGVACLVGFSGQPVSLREEEIDALQKGLSDGVCAMPHPYLAMGRRVLIKAGPLAGLEGILLRHKGNLRVVLSIDLLQRSIAVQADVANLEPVPGKPVPRLQEQLRCVSR